MPFGRAHRTASNEVSFNIGSRDVTIPIPYWGIGIGIGRYWWVLVLVGIGIGIGIGTGIGIGIGISKTLRKCHFEKVLIFHKV